MFAYIARVTSIALDTLWRAPRRRRAHLARSQPYWCRTRDGLLFEVQPGQWIDHQIATYGVAERRFLETMATLLPQGAVMVDVGANIGNHAIFLADVCSTIHCFEPNPTAWRRLEANIDANGFANIHVHRIGLGARDETASFRENVSGNLGNSGFTSGGGAVSGAGYRAVDLPIRNADREIDSLALDRLDYIKIDVEGLEEQVLGALGRTIARFRPLVSFEFHGKLADEGAFERLCACLPDYAIAEVIESPDGAPILNRLRWLLRYAAGPILTRVEQAEWRTYDNLLAIPLEQPLTRRLASD